MAVPLSKVDIACQSCDLLGEPPVDSIDTPVTETEYLLARNYDSVREDLLRDHYWNFAIGFYTCSRSGTPEGDYTDQYDTPSDFLRLISAGGEEETERLADINITSDRKILANNDGSATLLIRYVKNITDLSLWDAKARTALVYKLAAKVAYAITKSNRTAIRLAQEAEEKTRQAKSVDGTERPPHKRHSSVIRERRRRFGGNDNSREYPFG